MKKIENNFTVSGFVGKDAEIRQFANASVARFSLAVGRQEKTGEDPLTVFKKAMDNVRPTLECKPKRVGGATYQVPMEVNSRRATTLAIRWIVDFSRKRKEHTMRERLANEIIDASNNTGAAVKKREDMYKMAEANRAFSHYRF